MRHVHAALFLGQRNPRGIPAVRELPRGIADRQPGIVDELGTGDSLRLVLVIARLPHAGEVGLRETRPARHDERTRRNGAASDMSLVMIGSRVFVHSFVRNLLQQRPRFRELLVADDVAAPG
jgi:hypothetical protein